MENIMVFVGNGTGDTYIVYPNITHYIDSYGRRYMLVQIHSADGRLGENRDSSLIDIGVREDELPMIDWSKV